MFEKLMEANKKAREQAQRQKSVDSFLYMLDMVLARESQKYRDMKVSLTYEYIPVEGEFREVISYSYLTGRTKMVQGGISIDKGKDFLDIMAELFNVLQNSKGKK